MCHLLALTLLILAVTGCTLTTAVTPDAPTRNAQDLPTLTTTITLRPTQTLAPTNTPLIPSLTPTRQQVGSNPGNQPRPVCFPRNDWPIYTVVRGDTLGSIARRVGSTTGELAAANCLTNPDLISNGQGLRVPRLPAPVITPPPGNAGIVTVFPYISYSSTGYMVAQGASLTLTWPEARRDAARVEFYQSRGGVVSTIGADSFPADGAVVAWTAPSNETFVYATAYMANGSQQSTISPVRVISTSPDPVDPGAVYVSPYLYLDGTRYIVAANTTVTINWPNAPVTQSSRVEFYITYAGSGTTERIGTDNNMGDGASISYAPRSAGVIYATAFRTNGSTLNSRSAEIGIEAQSRIQGDVVVSPYVRTEGSSYGLRTGSTVTLAWTQPPVGESSQAEFTLVTESGAVTSLGLDTNLSDGVSVQWTVTPFTRGQIYAASPLPGQNRPFVESRRLPVFSIDIVIVEPAIGQIVASPIVRNENGLIVLAANTPVTLTWPEAPQTAEVTRVEFFLTPTGAGASPSLIGTDSNINDGASISTPFSQGVIGYLMARAYLSDGRTSETATQIQIRVE